jgi:hypothetical protein
MDKVQKLSNSGYLTSRWLFSIRWQRDYLLLRNTVVNYAPYPKSEQFAPTNSLSLKLIWYFTHINQFFLSELFLRTISTKIRSRDSSVGIATGYELDDREVGFRVPVGVRIFTSPHRPDGLRGPSNLLSNGYRGSFSGGKAVGAWSWPFTS